MTSCTYSEKGCCWMKGISCVLKKARHHYHSTTRKCYCYNYYTTPICLLVTYYMRVAMKRIQIAEQIGCKYVHMYFICKKYTTWWWWSSSAPVKHPIRKLLSLILWYHYITNYNHYHKDCCFCCCLCLSASFAPLSIPVFYSLLFLLTFLARMVPFLVSLDVNINRIYTQGFLHTKKAKVKENGQIFYDKKKL